MNSTESKQQERVQHWSASPAYTRALLSRPQPDRSYDDAGLWRRCQFTTPATVPRDRVEFHFDDYRNKFGKALELEGWDVLYMGQPFLPDDVLRPVEPDRRLYHILAWVKRRPRDWTFWVPDNAVPAVQKLGLKLED